VIHIGWYFVIFGEEIDNRLFMNRRKYLILFLIVGSITLIGLVAYGVLRRPNATPNPEFTQLNSVHAMRIDYLDINSSQQEVNDLESRMKQVETNMVALGAGRVDWTYFPWKGHPDRWSSAVKHTGVDYLARDSARFSEWAHVSAVVDMLAPRYLQSHPDEAAISYTGVASTNLVSTMDLVNGDFGQDALDMIEFIAANYPVSSITISELVYYVDGFGENDKTAYMNYSGNADWPRTASGGIDIDHPSVGEWRVYEIGRFLEKAATIVHQYNKQLFFDVNVSLDTNGDVVVKNGTDLDAFLQYVDRVVVWGNHDLDGQPTEAISQVASYLSQFGVDKVIMMIGLWEDIYSPDFPKEQMVAIPAAELKVLLESTMSAGIPNHWVSPSFLMSQEHWNVLEEQWGKKPTSP
jgi:hypothetical protein